MTRTIPGDIFSLLQQRADELPDRTIYRYLGETGGPSNLDYAQLLQASCGVAARLGPIRNERVLLLFPPGLEFITAFFGCAAAGAIAVPAPPPNPLRPKRSLQRLMTILQSAQPGWVLTVSAIHEALRPALAEMPAFAALSWVAVDELPSTAPAAAALGAPAPDDIAFIQYTSGSTSDPKGAAISHRSLVENIAYIDDGWDHGEDAVMVNWLPAFHDLGLVYGVLTPIMFGFSTIQMSPLDVIQRPLAWLTAISRHRGTHSGGPNFIFELCTRKIAQEDLLTLDLRSWRVAMTAAEPVRAETLARFARRFAPVGFDRRAFSPGYGLSEGTCKVISVPTSEEPLILTLRADRLEQHAAVLAEPGPDTRTVVGCGRPGRDVRIEIVDAQTRQRRAEDQVGEIWISGHGVAQSYWGQPEATEQYLRATILGEESPRFLRTGDLGFLHDGQLFITGRIKDMIIVRGTNHYPQDIESTVQDAHPCIRAGCCAAFAYEEEGEERVAVVAEVERRQLDAWIPNNDRRIADPTPRLPPSSASFDADEVGEAITRAVAEEHGLRVSRVALIRAGAIPKTTSGKIQRQATKKALLQGQLELITNPAGEREAKQSTWDLTRSRITEIVSRIAGIPADKLRPSVSLHNYGVDSLSAVNITYEIGLLIQADAPSWLLTERDTIDKLVDYVLSAGGKQ